MLEDALAASEERYRTIVDQMHDGCYGLDLEGNFIFANDGVCRDLGRTREELIGKNAGVLIPEESRKARRKEFIEVFKTGKPKINTVNKLTRKNGEVFYSESSIALLKGPGGEPAGFLCVARDITDRRLAEKALRESEEKYRLLAENARDIIWTMDMNLQFTYMSPSVLQVRGYTVEEVMAQSLEEVFTPSSLEIASKAFAEELALENMEPKDLSRMRKLELEHTCKDGSTVWVEINTSFLRDTDGQPIGILGVSRDITQRKMLEDALAASEERYRTILDQMHDGCYGLDLDGNFIFINDAVCRDTGYTREELMGKNAAMLIPEENSKARRKEFIEILRTGKPKTNSISQLIRKNGEVHFMESSISLLKTPGGEPAGYLCVARDITQRKALEKALTESEERYHSMLERMLDSYYEVDLAGNFTFLNTATCRNLGYEKGELDSKNYRVIMPEDEIDRIFSAFHRVYETGEPNTGFSHRAMRKDRSIGFAESSIVLLQDKQGNPIGFSCLARDITERTLLEKELQRSEEKYRTMLEQMQDGYYEVDLKGNYTFANTAAANFLGIQKEQLIGTNYRVLTPPDEVDRVFQAYNQVFKSGKPNNGFAHTITKKDSQSILCESSIDVRKNERGEVIGFKSVVRDVTERKMLEAELRLSEEKYRTILEEMEDAYYEVDLSGNFTFVNEATSRHTGYAAEELTKMNFRQVTYEEDINPVFTAFNNVYRSGEANKGYSHRMIKKDGSVGYVEAAISVLKDKRGAIVGFRCVSRDVTERQQLEKKLADMATHDFLTGLPNRILLNDRFQVALAQANRNNYKLGIMSLDLDHFKEVNDSLGHAVGDELLTAAGTRLSNILRSSDTVARLGGDEFLLLLQEIHGPEDAILIAEKIVDSCKEPLRINGHQLHISTSIGIAIYPDNGEDMDTLMRKSDAAMYFSKRHGGMQYKVFTTSDQLDISQS
jgi:diguanylate cyclase (GGDEF)-like protein/PAS domain S-box-containing protein